MADGSSATSGTDAAAGLADADREVFEAISQVRGVGEESNFEIHI